MVKTAEFVQGIPGATGGIADPGKKQDPRLHSTGLSVPPVTVTMPAANTLENLGATGGSADTMKNQGPTPQLAKPPDPLFTGTLPDVNALGNLGATDRSADTIKDQGPLQLTKLSIHPFTLAPGATGGSANHVKKPPPQPQLFKQPVPPVTFAEPASSTYTKTRATGRNADIVRIQGPQLASTTWSFPPVEPANGPYRYIEANEASAQRSLGRPQSEHAYLQPQDDRLNVANDLTRFLLRKDLALSRLSQYNDKAETYQAWKASFTDVVREMGVSPAEEIDLLIKWLGPDSKRHAVTLRSAYNTDYVSGLKKIWERLDDRYGSVESVHQSVMSKLERFPKISARETAKLYVLADLLSEIYALKQDQRYATALSYFDSSVGVNPIVEKVPFLQEKWARRAMDFKKHRGIAFPPFEIFTDFINDQAKLRNDPGLPLFTAQVHSEKKDSSRHRHIFTKITEIEKPPRKEASLRCPIHKTDHTLDSCRSFKSKSMEDRRTFLKQNKLCFKCLNAAHQARDCPNKIKCEVCSSQSHCTLMHLYRPQPNGGERVSSSCTEICGRRVTGKSCAKLVLVNVYHQRDPTRQIKAYAILDEQSNRSLAKPELFHQLGIDGQNYEYTLNSCSGRFLTQGRRASGCTVEALNGTSHSLPTLIECADIPDNRDEIPTPRVVQHHKHLADLEKQIPELDEDAEILLLIGRDMTEAHHVLEQRLGPPNTPFAQRLSLGWVVVGEVCLGKTHQPNQVNVNKLYLLNNGRPSYFEPCPSEFLVKEKNVAQSETPTTDQLFERTKDDERPAMSVEDKEFVHIMNKEFRKDTDGKWVAPLPFRQPQHKLPNNRPQALKRAKLLDTNLRRNPDKMQHFLKFMDNIFSNGHAELAPELKPGEGCCFLPIFGVYNAHKPDQIRAVFDSSAKQDNISLNDVLIHGPDLTNSLLGVLLRFRREPVAIAADIQQMFYSFKVEEKHRNFLRFFWYRDNKPNMPLAEYRMCVHVFGNSPSPAIATYGLRQSVRNRDNDVREFVNKNFYVDDGLTSLPTESKAIDLLKRTQEALAESGLKLHKIVSNSKDVMRAFPAEDLAKDLKDVNFDSSDLPTQRSLGVTWDLEADAFKFNILLSGKKGTTRRSILSEVNSIFDPLGFLSPVTIEGKLILRDVVADTAGWDDYVSPILESRWRSWREALSQLEDFQIPRTYAPESPGLSSESKLIVFSDASEKAVAASAYLHTRLSNGSDHVGFVIGKAKVAPSRGHTIPRLELCAAVLATELASTVTEQLEMDMSKVMFFTDSKVILGYIQNRKKRFYTYVSNRVAKIHNRTSPSQWNYVPTDANPADCATRPIQVKDFLTSSWLRGPTRLPTTSNNKDDGHNYELVTPEEDEEVRPEVRVSKTVVKRTFENKFEKFSTWASLIRAISFLKRNIRTRKQDKEFMPEPVTVSKQTEDVVIREAQNSAFQTEIEMLRKKRPVPLSSSICTLTPFLDDKDILRLGGRIKKAPMESSHKHPIILPRKSHVALLIVRHFHEKVHHQGRLITEAAVRSGGFWIIGAKRLIGSVLQGCVTCRRLRGKFQAQRMGDLPVDRLSPGAPFTVCGVDVFGPWAVVARKTRGGLSQSKRWAVIFTCMATRAVHLEVLEDMSSPAFINAMRRFVALRGPVKEFRSDRGTNFVGALESIHATGICVEDGPVQKHLHGTGTVWRFNPPHASHMGGAWERLIGIARRILDSMLLNSHGQKLTHEVLCTFMCEVCAVMNSRPIAPLSADPENPEVISPAMLLTQKTEGLQPLTTSMDMKDLYRSQWRYVQLLSNTFWKRWRNGYLQTLQTRCKWTEERPNVKVGDVVLLKDTEVHRNQWPLGIVTRTFPSDSDNNVRTVELRVTRGEKTATYVRPVTEMVLLLE